ncbi:hypothetical protein GQ42DRAFT_157040 [Ramicandelaber brevisporus]|nr:hypothetical protein GQ42DRAFT_62312 [Ramicandelaber brevisporus]KAI8868482.1 hypothetical protein GQ42DRAFT_157040 [Ramicandelaber brevisporus]
MAGLDQYRDALNALEEIHSRLTTEQQQQARVLLTEKAQQLGTNIPSETELPEQPPTPSAGSRSNSKHTFASRSGKEFPEDDEDSDDELDPSDIVRDGLVDHRGRSVNTSAHRWREILGAAALAEKKTGTSVDKSLLREVSNQLIIKPNPVPSSAKAFIDALSVLDPIVRLSPRAELNILKTKMMAEVKTGEDCMLHLSYFTQVLTLLPRANRGEPKDSLVELWQLMQDCPSSPLAKHAHMWSEIKHAQASFDSCLDRRVAGVDEYATKRATPASASTSAKVAAMSDIETDSDYSSAPAMKVSAKSKKSSKKREGGFERWTASEKTEQAHRLQKKMAGFFQKKLKAISKNVKLVGDAKCRYCQGKSTHRIEDCYSFANHKWKDFIAEGRPDTKASTKSSPTSKSKSKSPYAASSSSDTASSDSDSDF